MIPNRDYYADRNGKLTEDPEQYARQIAVKGVFLDERTASRFGISDTLVPTDEPNAPRRVTARGESSVKITKAEESAEQSEEEEVQEPQEPAEASGKKTAAKKGEK